jgi:hypothetical protein
MSAVGRRVKVYRFEGADEYNPPIIDYASMSRDELVDHFIDDNGLAHFLDVQYAGIEPALWDWRIIARDLYAFCSYLTFSPEYLKELYAMQKERQAVA